MSENNSENLIINRNVLLKATGLVLKTARKGLNKSQEELANESEISKTTISNIENGIKSPTMETWFKLFSMLEMDISKSIKAIQIQYEALGKIEEITLME